MAWENAVQGQGNPDCTSNNCFMLFWQFKRHISRYYPLLCNMLLVECKLELRSVLRRVFQRVGTTFGICDLAESCWQTHYFIKSIKSTGSHGPLQSIFLWREMFQLEEVKWMWLDSKSFLNGKRSSAKASVVIHVSRFDIEMIRGFWKKKWQKFEKGKNFW